MNDNIPVLLRYHHSSFVPQSFVICRMIQEEVAGILEMYGYRSATLFEAAEDDPAVNWWSDIHFDFNHHSGKGLLVVSSGNLKTLNRSEIKTLGFFVGPVLDPKAEGVDASTVYLCAALVAEEIIKQLHSLGSPIEPKPEDEEEPEIEEEEPKIQRAPGIYFSFFKSANPLRKGSDEVLEEPINAMLRLLVLNGYPMNVGDIHPKDLIRVLHAYVDFDESTGKATVIMSVHDFNGELGTGTSTLLSQASLGQGNEWCPASDLADQMYESAIDLFREMDKKAGS